jgi:large subunit ribosomal protein L19
MNLINEIEKEYQTREQNFTVGDLVRVHVKIVEGKRERIQIFEGYVIMMRGSGVTRTFTVRKISSGIGVERTFPLHTPVIDKVELIRKGRVRQSKLFYLRDRKGKRAVIKEKINYKNK